MKVSKILETRIDVKDSSDIFCSNYDLKLLNLLRIKYKNRCFKGIFILDVKNIVRRSSLRCKNKVLDGSTYVDISFEVIGIMYEYGDIIHKCKISHINNNGTMFAKSEFASIYIKNVNGGNLFKIDDEIPVIVNMVGYTLYDKGISVSAIPLVPIIKKSTIFKVIKDEINDTNNNEELFDVLIKELCDKIKNNLQEFNLYNAS